MAKQSIDEQIQERIHSFASELSELIKAAALDSVAEVLGGRMPASGTAVTKRKRASSRGSRVAKPGKRFRRTVEHLRGDKQALLDHVKDNPGQRLEEISKAMGIDSKSLKKPASMLLEEGKLRKEGERRGTRYFSGGRRVAKSRVAKGKKKARRKKR